jgi:hypothetical protein
MSPLTAVNDPESTAFLILTTSVGVELLVVEASPVDVALAEDDPEEVVAWVPEPSADKL